MAKFNNSSLTTDEQKALKRLKADENIVLYRHKTRDG